MMLPKEQRIPTLNKHVRGILEEFVNRRSLPADFKVRAEIVLLAADGLSNKAIAEKTHCHVNTAAKWRKRFMLAAADLNQLAKDVEEAEPDNKKPIKSLRECITTVLRDSYRSGAPVRYGLIVVFWLIWICCKKPEDFGFVASQWSLPMLRQAMIGLDIVKDISTSVIYNKLINFDLRPWKNSYYLNSPDKDENPDIFKSKIRNINLIYHIAKLAYAEFDKEEKDPTLIVRGEKTLDQLKDEIKKIESISLIMLLKQRQLQLMNQESQSETISESSSESVDTIEDSSSDEVDSENKSNENINVPHTDEQSKPAEDSSTGSIIEENPEVTALIAVLKQRQQQLMDQDSRSENSTESSSGSADAVENSSSEEVGSENKSNENINLPHADEQSKPAEDSSTGSIIEENPAVTALIAVLKQRQQQLMDQESQFGNPSESTSGSVDSVPHATDITEKHDKCTLNPKETVKEIRHEARLFRRINDTARQINLSYEYNSTGDNDDTLAGTVFENSKNLIKNELPYTDVKSMFGIYSYDEKTGIQALERKYPDKPSVPGMVKKTEQEYIRHGTISMIPFCNVINGNIDFSYLNTTRTEADLAEAYFHFLAMNKDKVKIVIVCDNLNTHVSESIVMMTAEFNGDTQDLGKKGVRGILKNKETREAYLSDPTHRVYFAFTPRHCSWMNISEVFFAAMSRRLLNNNSFKSVGNLCDTIEKYVTQHNNFYAHPCDWKYNSVPEQKRIEKFSLFRNICNKFPKNNSSAQIQSSV